MWKGKKRPILGVRFWEQEQDQAGDVPKMSWWGVISKHRKNIP